MKRSLTRVLSDVAEEYMRAEELFPGGSQSAHEGYAVLLEEVDELWEVVKENQKTPGRSDRLRKEAIQVAAMAVRFLMEMEEYK